MNERETVSSSGNPQELPLRVITLSAGGMGVFYGGLSHLVWGSQAGLEVGLGLGGLTAGLALGINSSNRAERFAKEGRPIRAYVEALKSLIESAMGVGVMGAAVGFHLGHIPGAVLGFGVGALIGGGGNWMLVLSKVERGLRYSV